MKAKLSERDFQKQVIALAKLYGWTVAHFRPARVMRNGVEKYETPVAVDGKGFPDLVLVHPERGVLFVELKTDTGELSDAQAGWVAALYAAGAAVRVWRPRDWDVIEATLRG